MDLSSVLSVLSSGGRAFLSEVYQPCPNPPRQFQSSDSRKRSQDKTLNAFDVSIKRPATVEALLVGQYRKGACTGDCWAARS